jgi:hypothetical protein
MEMVDVGMEWHAHISDLNRCVFNICSAPAKWLGTVRRKGGMVDVGMEWQRRRWCVLVGEGGDYKMVYCWLVSDKTRGSNIECNIFLFLC